MNHDYTVNRVIICIVTKNFVESKTPVNVRNASDEAITNDKELSLKLKIGWEVYNLKILCMDYAPKTMSIQTL